VEFLEEGPEDLLYRSNSFQINSDGSVRKVVAVALGCVLNSMHKGVRDARFPDDFEHALEWVHEEFNNVDLFRCTEVSFQRAVFRQQDPAEVALLLLYDITETHSI